MKILPILIICATIIIFICFAIYFLRKIKVIQLNKSIQLENQSIEQDNIKIRDRNTELAKELNQLSSEKDNLQAEKEKIVNDIKQQQEIYERKRDGDKKALQDAYDINLELIENRFERAAMIERQKYLEAENDYKEQYNEMMAELSQEYVRLENSMQQEYQEKLIELKEKVNGLKEIYGDLKTSVDAATASLKRALEEANQQDFYRLNIPKEDLIEIELLREIELKLRDPTPLNKVIWKVYYEKPYTDLIGRAILPDQKIGIYKITNMITGMAYVGQSRDLANRWRQHIKRGIGAEAPTKNKLYPAMKEYGVENFMFEIIEYCSPEDLNAKEDYWQEFFHCKDFGYSIK